MELLDLYDQVLLRIFSVMDCFTLVHMSVVCRRFRSLQLNEELWRNIFQQWDQPYYSLWKILNYRAIVMTKLKSFQMLRIALLHIGSRGAILWKYLPLSWIYYSGRNASAHPTHSGFVGRHLKKLGLVDTMQILRLYTSEKTIKLITKYNESDKFLGSLSFQCPIETTIISKHIFDIGYRCTSPLQRKYNGKFLFDVILDIHYFQDEQYVEEIVENGITYNLLDYLTKSIFEWIWKHYQVDMGLEMFSTKMKLKTKKTLKRKLKKEMEGETYGTRRMKQMRKQNLKAWLNTCGRNSKK